MDAFRDFILPDDEPEDWQARRERIHARVMSYFGRGPEQARNLEPQWGESQKGEGYVRRKVSYQVDEGVRAPAYVFVPEGLKTPAPVVMCYHGTNQMGKEAVCGANVNMNYAVELARRGYVTMAPDQWVTGERDGVDGAYHETKKLYERYPNWSVEGKTAWDHMRAVDLLETLPEANTARLGATGHSRGGRATIYHMLLDPRVKAAAPSCGTPPWRGEPRLGQFALRNEFITFPKAHAEVKAGQAVGFDIHEVIALNAPRPQLLISPFIDQFCPHGHLLSEMAEKIAALYRFIGAGNHFARFAHGEGHNTGPVLRAALYAWFDFFLKGEVPGLPGNNYGKHAPGVPAAWEA